MAVQQALQGALERLQLTPGPGPAKRIAPRSLDVPDHGQSPAAGVTKQALRQPGDEGLRGDGPALAEYPVGELAKSGRAGCVTREVEGDQPEKPRVAGYVVGGKMEVGGDLPVTRPRPGPVLAQQRSLVRQ